MSKQNNELYEFGSFRLDIGEHTLTLLDGTSTGQLPEKAFQTLCLLVQNRGSLLTKRELIDQIWPDSFVEENNLTKAIYVIRRSLDDRNGNTEYIETVSKHGYRFIADVKRIEPGHYRNGGSARGKRNRFPDRSPAYDLYIRGKVKSGNVTRAETEAAIGLLQQAITIDSNFAEAYAQIARANIRMAFNFSTDEDRQAFIEDAEVAIEAALDLEPDLAEGHFARGLLLWTHAKGFANEQAIKSYKRSLDSNPTADETHHQLSMVYGHVGLLDEALESVNRAIDLNPNNTMARFRVSNYLAWQCKFAEAIASLKSVPSDVSPLLVDRIKSEIYIHVGRGDDAAVIVNRHLKKHSADEGGSFISVKALILAQRGERKEAKKTIARLVEVERGLGHFHHTAYNIASAYAALGEPDEGVRWLEAAADDGFPCYTYFEKDPNLDGLRTHPRFINLMSVLHKQWRSFKKLV